MGARITKTYPRGILKTPKHVRFDKAEVRLMHHDPDRWDTCPLVTHPLQEVRIKRLPVNPVRQAVPEPWMPAPKKPKVAYKASMAEKKVAVGVVVGVISFAISLAAGPFGLIPLGVVVGGLLLHSAYKVAQKNYGKYVQKVNDFERCKRYAAYYKEIGDIARYKMYYRMANQLHKELKR